MPGASAIIPPMARPYRFPLVVLILLGTFLRFYRLNDIPPGLHYDIASNALLTNSIAFDGWRPVFIGAFTGKEVLFFYWAALWFRLLGPSVFALRLAAALLGVLAIPATFFAVRAMFRHERRSGWLATLAALFLAASFMNVVWSRFGLRVIAEPVAQAGGAEQGPDPQPAAERRAREWVDLEEGLEELRPAAARGAAGEVLRLS